MRVPLASVGVLLLSGAGLGCPGKANPPPFDAGFHHDAGGFDAGDPDACGALEPGDPGIVFGSGEDAWVEVSDGDALPFYRGPQDGYHFYGSVKERNIDTSAEAIVAFAVFDGEEQINDGLGVYARPPAWIALGDGFRATVGFFVVMNIDGPEEVDGHTFCVIVRVTDASSDVYVDQRTISVTFDGDM